MSADVNSIVQTCIFAGQLLATTLTFMFLYKSLQAQKKANDLTNKKFIYDIKPIFKRTFKEIDRGFISPIQFLNYTIVLTNNAAFKVSIIKHTFHATTGFIERDKMPLLAINEEILIIDGRFSPHEFKQEVVINIRFSDEVGTRYEQRIHGNLADLHITPPYIIS